jgi:3-oxoacyl-[acyl-carrier protein] reductase
MALALAEAGAEVIVTSRTPDDAERALAAMGKIDILVNNAGNVVSTPHNKPLEQRPLEEWEFTVGVNMTGVFLCSKHVVARAMKPARSGAIINIASVAGRVGKDHRVYRGTPLGGVTIDYAAAKAGVIGMTKVWAKELGKKGITVNAVAPGFIATEMVAAMPEEVLAKMREKVPVARLGAPEEIASAYAFLASEEAGYINGTTLSVDGGITL